MSSLDLICITQSHAYERHLSIFKLHSQICKQFGKAISLRLVSDTDSFDCSKHLLSNYEHDVWSSCIDAISTILAGNIVAARHPYISTRGRSAWKKQLLLEINNLNTYFAPRQLSFSEIDVACRHYSALQLASKSNNYSLILEDDAIPKNNTFDFLSAFIASSGSPSLCSHLVFLDMCDYPSILDFLGCSYFTAVTRTLCAYVVSPRTATLLLQNFSPFSLPVDLHFQYILSKLSHPGSAAPKGSSFLNGSLAGYFRSSILPSLRS